MRTESEEAFQTAVIQLARFEGWSVWHPPKNLQRPTLGVVAGWPDLGLARLEPAREHLRCSSCAWLYPALHTDVLEPCSNCGTVGHLELAGGEFLLAELKAAKTKVTQAQLAAHELLRACGLEVRLWRPSDWPEIRERLAR
jgi:hypothetical protein